MRHLPAILGAVVLALGLAALPPRLASRPSLTSDFVHFESSHVHPIALTPDGNRLLVVNTPDHRLSVFDLTGPAPVRIAEIPVGLEPVSVAARHDGEAWVVNRLSDDVSIVNLTTLHVRATVRVGDEPSDVVFAGAPRRAFVSVSEEDVVRVYDPDHLAAAPVTIPIPGRRPRALARSGDGARVLVNVFTSSGGATVLSHKEVGDSLPAPDPPLAPGLPPPPHTGLVVVQNAAGDWVDPSGRIWNSKVPYQVPKVEVVTIDAATHTVSATRGDIATTMLGLAVDPASGRAVVTGTLARLDLRLEPRVRGRFTEQRLGIFPDPAGPAVTVPLNPHIDYSVTPGPPAEADSALGLPTGVCWSPDGRRIYVTSMATAKLGVLDEGGRLLARVPTVAGPTGVIADPGRDRLYVVGRFHNQLETLAGASLARLGVTAIGFDPTPDAIVNGRKFFYGGFTSGHGDQSCASCHLFGDTDHLVWDLGDPRGSYQAPPPGHDNPSLVGFHPMKGPMSTQSLRGLLNTGLLHWRGDRADLAAFNGAFVGLMGRSTALPDSEMAAFTDFVMALAYPPNPNMLLDRTVADAPAGRPSAARGRHFFINVSVDRPRQCEDCHRLPTGTNGQVIDRLVLLETQDLKIPQLRNLYTKVGFSDVPGAVNKIGFGFIHDGSMDNVFNFLHFPGFIFDGDSARKNATRRDLEAFLMTFDTGMAPAVGRQITFDGVADDPGARSTLDTLEAQAAATNCDLIARGRVGTTPRGWLFQGGGQWLPDRAGESPISTAELVALAAPNRELTVSGVPVGTGERAALDRDRDGFLDGDERAAGSDPGDPASTPDNAPPPPLLVSRIDGAQPNPFHESTEIAFSLAAAGRVEIAVFDVLGRRVRGLARDLYPAGPQRLRWDGRRDDGAEAPSGVYFVRMDVDGRHWTRSVVRVR